MYDYFKGTITFVCPQYVTIEVQGIGYQFYAPHPLQFEHKQGQDTTIYTHHYVREDANLLYGFTSREERSLFQLLLNVSGIGPKGGLAIVASGSPRDIARAIEQENETMLTKFPGIGKKTARQMILDLKGKVDEFCGDTEGTHIEAAFAESKEKELEEALEALYALGYSVREVEKLKPSLQKETLTAEEYVKKALRLMLEGKRR
ncbi:Holliday junction branch migration protein RuvA [Bacillaceae bacterium SIJ1]|uniref:Holliday junction branch migration protein RuvA n=1 Tax=Litoribacterium kuwaitense TaxID=1398745 RepID=UPI0013E9BE26|nr:Holliday junction branch migration protein RuvA [Litoribacterium kuwaitense]NGP43429.1 Holliday junction branch migration protein RuvA [Litoribacterium kuwaitense]